MTLRRWLLALLLLLCWSVSLYAVARLRLGAALFPTEAGPVPDDRIRSGLVGTWIVPGSGLQGGQDDELRSVTEFHADGTGSVLMYSDISCARVIQRIPFAWSIGKGQLIYYAQGGRPAAAEIVDIGPKQFLLRGEDGAIRRRDRASSCARR